MANKKRLFLEYLFIFLGSVLYAFSTVFFIFPKSLLLGGTSGISVILTSFLSTSPGVILAVINGILLLLALLIFGKDMALKTFVGSALTTLFVSAFEKLFPLQSAPIENPFVSAGVGAALIALASAVMFYVNSSSGGTDIIALIVKKFSNIHIGNALLITDVIIVVIGGIMSGWVIAVSSFEGLLIKTLGIDLFIKVIKHIQEKGAKETL